MKCMPHEQERRKKKAHNSRHQTMPQFMKGTSMKGNFLNYKDLEFVGLPKAKVNIKGNIKIKKIKKKSDYDFLLQHQENSKTMFQ